VDLVAVRGSGATPARVNLLRRARTEGYLAKKKVVIWCFGAREFTEASGWQKVPVVK
jgi:alginate O-acetyltransferase complex protein AlgJ